MSAPFKSQEERLFIKYPFYTSITIVQDRFLACKLFNFRLKKWDYPENFNNKLLNIQTSKLLKKKVSTTVDLYSLELECRFAPL